ncbi:hypothetical protein O6H91_20G023600 [Diphasiastrum complanatum]|nr:hypothetical protein O6H91_20G023600 [Diphasiastrum complanatum]
MLVDRWMTQKMQDAERLNEANAMYEDMMERFKATRLEELARQQVDGIVRYSEAGAENYVVSRLPKTVRHTIRAHDGACSALAFENNGHLVFSGGHDCLVKVWDTTAGTIVNTLRGCLGSVVDVAVSVDNNLVLGASTDHKLYLWDANSSRIRHTLTGHSEKVVATDFSKTTNRRAISAAHDRTIKLWDLVSGYGVNTIICYSNCNSACLTSDASIICSGHLDGSLRQWDLRSGKLTNEVAAHGQGITSVSLSRNGHSILTTGRDNFHTVFDVHTLEVRARFSAPGYRAATNWSRSCMSADEKYVAAGSADGAVFLWNWNSNELESTLKSHTSTVLACVWSDVGRSLITSDKAGSICIWE